MARAMFAFWMGGGCGAAAAFVPVSRIFTIPADPRQYTIKGNERINRH